tara:strand:+ start:443 stop:559 length:117 start_codon:yes stop_codon:yes gene_type:complete
MMDKRNSLNLFGYISGTTPSIIRINAKTVATICRVVIF